MDPRDNAEMFTRIAATYDLLNHLLSANVDAAWRRAAVDGANAPADARWLDLCTGTGDLALLAAKRFPRARVVGADASPGMLEAARRKAASARAKNVSLVRADAVDLPFPDRSFGAVTLAFGLRNLADPEAGLREAVRVTEPGARLVVLEFVRPPGGWFGRIFTFYLDRLLPALGGAVSGHRYAYRFLATSIEAFWTAPEIAGRMREAGCGAVEARRLFFGIAGLFTGTVGAIGVRS
jgi:demethylmenaquinone methyltransferase/2-methoxy-6-polyprenyl-1,4-benzoquinol methylase